LIFSSPPKTPIIKLSELPLPTPLRDNSPKQDSRKKSLGEGRLNGFYDDPGGVEWSGGTFGIGGRRTFFHYHRC
jgi:hypothetical protein